jgi:hypothetical protein
VYIEDVCYISATVATYAVIVSVLHEAVSSELILAVCDLTSLEPQESEILSIKYGQAL